MNVTLSLVPYYFHLRTFGTVFFTLGRILSFLRLRLKCVFANSNKSTVTLLWPNMFLKACCSLDFVNRIQMCKIFFFSSNTKRWNFIDISLETYLFVFLFVDGFFAHFLKFVYVCSCGKKFVHLERKSLSKCMYVLEKDLPKSQIKISVNYQEDCGQLCELVHCLWLTWKLLEGPGNSNRGWPGQFFQSPEEQWASELGLSVPSPRLVQRLVHQGPLRVLGSPEK